jgi:hypothetical protein
MPHLAGADLQGFQGTLDGGIGQIIAITETLAETHDSGKTVHDLKTVLRRPGNQQAAVVGPQIKGPENLGLCVAVSAPVSDCGNVPPNTASQPITRIPAG